MMKRKWIAALLMLMIFACTAKAETIPGESTGAYEKWAKGITQAADTVDLFAPVGGQVQAFEVKTGDVVAAGDALISIRPLQIQAPFGGIIRLLKAKVGDQAAAVMQQYSALCFIDREDVMLVRATTSSAFNKPKNRSILLGEALRIYNDDSNDPLDTLGTVISVDAKGYMVEIPADVFELEDKVRLYRGEGDTYNDKDRVGEGKVERSLPAAILGNGVIAGVHVTEGQHVVPGDVLFTLDDASSVYKNAAELQAVPQKGGVVSALYVQDGQQVRKDQLLLTLRPLDALEFVVDVDELDIPSVSVGQTMQVKVDALGENRMTAVVEKINPLGMTVLDTTKYQVTLSVQGTSKGLLPGMHITAYWE